MTTTTRKMPIGVQDFAKLITERCVYVDKTEILYNLVKNSSVVFLSRPRRFGKSLFLSTLKQYFLGNKDIFKGLAIEKLEEENPTAFDGVAWAKHPVIYIDLNSEKFESAKSLQLLINRNLEPYEKQYGLDSAGETISGRFSKLIRAAAEKSGRKTVVLVDEYDKPLLQAIGNDALFDDYRATLKAFYGVLKSEDAYLRFSMLTGVTKFSKVSVWSDLNNLRDISMLSEYSDICGITEKELHTQFQPEVEKLAERNELTIDECFAELKKRYDGYHFVENSPEIYNPFSLINVLADSKFSDYWFQTGTPTFLVEEIKRNNFDLRNLIDGVDVESERLSEFSLGGTNPIPILMQSGYLTIKKYDSRFKTYNLGLPNEEVKYGFLKFLSPEFLGKKNNDSDFNVIKFIRDIESGDVDAFMTRLKSVIASLPYPTDTQGRGIEMLEYNFQVAVYLTFTLMGQFTQCEVHSIKGRADAVVETSDTVYIFEFKTNDTAQNALSQIEKSAYAEKYAASSKRTVKIGAAFSTEKREMTEWVLG